MLTNKSFGIVYLDRNSFTYYSQNSTAINFTYPSSSIRELEVLNEELFNKEASEFIKSNKLIGGMIMILLAPDLLYEKVIIDDTLSKEPQPDEKDKIPADKATQEKNNEQVKTNPPSDNNISKQTLQEQRNSIIEDRNRLIQTFLEIIPLEEVASKTYKIEKGVKIIATNKRLYEMVIGVFNKYQFITDSVIPFTVLGTDIISGSIMNQDIATKIIRKYVTLKQYSLLEENSYALSRAATETHGLVMTAKVKSKKDYLLIGVFVCLLGVLGILAYPLVIPAKKSNVKLTPTVIYPTEAVTPTIVQTDQSASSSAVITKEIMKINIVGGTDMQSGILKQDLISSGYKNVTTIPGNTPASGKTVIIFSAVVPLTTRNEILQQLKRNLLNITAQEVASPEADVIINL